MIFFPPNWFVILSWGCLLLSVHNASKHIVTSIINRKKSNRQDVHSDNQPPVHELSKHIVTTTINRKDSNRQYVHTDNQPPLHEFSPFGHKLG